MMAGNVMHLAAFLQETNPEPMVSALNIPDLKRKRCSDAGKGKGHQRNQRPIPDPSGVGLDLS